VIDFLILTRVRCTLSVVHGAVRRSSRSPQDVLLNSIPQLNLVLDWSINMLASSRLMIRTSGCRVDRSVRKSPCATPLSALPAGSVSARGADRNNGSVSGREFVAESTEMVIAVVIPFVVCHCALTSCIFTQCRCGVLAR